MKVEVDSLRSTKKRMKATREDGDIFGALCRGKHLDHGGESFDPLAIARKPLDSKFSNAFEIGEVKEALAAPYQLVYRALA